MEKVTRTTYKSKDSIIYFLDFSGGQTEEEISNNAHNLIHNIANLEHNLRKWASHNSKDKDKVNDTMASSLELRIIRDLSNNDKHGYGRNTASGLNPKLESIGSAMRIQPDEGASMALSLTKEGFPKVSGKGTAKVIITGQIVGENGESVGNLYDIASKAIQDWEALLKSYGLL